MNPILATILIANMLYMLYDMIRKRQSNWRAWVVIIISLLYFVFHIGVFLVIIVVYTIYFYSERKQNGDRKKEVSR